MGANKKISVRHAFRKIRKMRSMMKNFHSTQPLKKVCRELEANRDNSDTKTNMYKDKSLGHLTQTTESVQLNNGKLCLMKRFLRDVDKTFDESIPNEDNFGIPFVRQEGDGKTGSPLSTRTRGDGISLDESHFDIPFIRQEGDSKAGTILCPRIQGDGSSEDESFFSSFTRNTTCKNIPTTIQTKDDSVDFNTAFLDDADSMLGSESEVSIGELEMNIMEDINDSCAEDKLDVVKKLFSKSDLTTWFADDDAMDSFMKTMGVPEGISSMSGDSGVSRQV